MHGSPLSPPHLVIVSLNTLGTMLPPVAPDFLVNTGLFSAWGEWKRGGGGGGGGEEILEAGVTVAQAHASVTASHKIFFQRSKYIIPQSVKVPIILGG